MQARAPKTHKFDKTAFFPEDRTIIRWLGNAGAMINCRGTTIMIDPILSGFDMPLLIDMPISEEEVPSLDAILLTHCDNDHYSRISCKKLANKVHSFHAPHYVAELLKAELGIHGIGHDIYDKFQIDHLSVKLTPADHAWQNESPKHHTRNFQMEDYCGYWLDTPDVVKQRIINPDRIIILAPGERYLLQKDIALHQSDTTRFFPASLLRYIY